ncbi:MAG: radical SAM protein [Cyanobacteriota bacterium]|nr:radical SAM protein [Cyanobacteriota bacterium]
MLCGENRILTREENRVLNLEEYRQGKTYLQSRPRYVMVELTQGCNLHCSMCRPEVIPITSRMMSEDVYHRIARELFPTADMVDLRGDGESLILPQIAKYIEVASDYGVAIRFVSNMSFQRDEILDLLVEKGCYLSVSVDSPDPEIFASLRRGGNLGKVERNLRKLAAGYRQRWGSTERLNLTTTVQRPALESLPALVDFAADIGIGEIRLASVHASPDSPLSLHERDAEVDLALKGMQERSRLHGVSVNASTTVGSIPQKPDDTAACLHPWSYVSYKYDGYIGFCDHLIGTGSEIYHLGHIDESSFEEVWNGEKWQTLRQEHLTSRCESAPHFKECSWCYKNRFIDFEDFFLPEAKAQVRSL